MLPPPAGYPPPNTRLPPDLIVQFWEDVFAALRADHGLPPADAVTAITRHRADEHLVGDMQYHRDAADVADTIAAGWQNGVLHPPGPSSVVSPSTSTAHPATTP